MSYCRQNKSGYNICHTDQVPACGPGLEYMLGDFPAQRNTNHHVRGDGQCAEVVWTFAGFSMGEWSLVSFTAYAAIFIWQLTRRSWLMSLINGVLILLVCQCAGEAIKSYFGLSLPGPAIGMFILFIGLVLYQDVPEAVA